MAPLVVVTPIYSALLALIFTALAIRVIGQRRIARVSLGDGGDHNLLRRQRAHANFAEYVPIVLILMLCAELQQAQQWLLNIIGLCLVIGRLIHAYAVSQDPEPMRLRVLGMTLTIAALLIAALGNVVLVMARVAAN